MKRNLIKKTALSLSLLVSLNSQASFMGILDNVMATINPNAGLVGPIYRHETKKQDGYGDELAKIIIQEAHKTAKRFLEEGNADAYYAFMALAFTVPNQEGLMVHFREVPADEKYCRDKRTEGKLIKSSKAKKQFQKTLNNRGLLRDTSSGFLVTCDKISGQPTYKQLIVGGADGSDVGIMQLSALWHYEEYLNEVKYASVRSTISYGLNYIMKRYKKAVRSYADLGCFSDTNGNPAYDKIIRGSWSAYNGGPSQLCRFSNENDPHAAKDKGFKGNLEKTMKLNDGGILGFNQDGELPLSDEVRAAVEQIISNLENGTNNRDKIAAILGA